MMQGKKHLRSIIIVFFLFSLIIFSFSLYFLIEDAQKTVTIKFFVAPASANITMNGESFSNLKTHKIRPGDYELIISKPDYFETWTANLTLNDGDSKGVYLQLNPLPSTNWYKDHPDEAHVIDIIIDHELSEKSALFQKEYPLIKKLPIKVEYYKNNSVYVYYAISYVINDDNTPTILINDYTGNNYDLALDRIRSEGFNPDDYYIEYQDKTAEIAPAFSPE